MRRRTDQRLHCRVSVHLYLQNSTTRATLYVSVATLACLSGPWSVTHLRWAFSRRASFVHVLIEKTKMKTTSIFDCKLPIGNIIYNKKQNDNAPMQCIAIFNSCKMNKMMWYSLRKHAHAIIIVIRLQKLMMTIFCLENLVFFLKNIDFGYMLEPPHLGGCNEYPQSILGVC